MSSILQVALGPLILKNPVMVSSGCFGFGQEYAKYIDIDKLGAIVLKGTTLNSKEGNPPPRIAETPAGMLNAVGLQNPGVELVTASELPQIEGVGTNLIANISGSTPEEYLQVAEKFAAFSSIKALELNVSCPNVKEGGMAFGTCATNVESLVKMVKKRTTKPLIVKLSPNVTDIAEIARAAEAGGADILSLINTLLGMVIDVNQRKPLLANITGGLSGPAIRPVAVRMVWQVSSAVKIPVIGMGGITCLEDALQFLMAGASAVSIGTANFTNPKVTIEIIEGLEQYCLENDLKNILEIRGIAKKG